MTEYLHLLEKEKDEKYKKFSEKIVSDTKYPLLGVRVPVIKKIAKTAETNGGIIFPKNGFTYYEECLLYGLIISGLKTLSFEEKTALLDDFLPYADSWGITDSVAAAFKDISKNRKKATEYIYLLLKSPLTYTRRFGIVLLTLYFTGEYFDEKHLLRTLSVKTGEYYVDMAVAWYISVLIAKNRDVAIKIIEDNVLPPFIHDKAINKAIESFRVCEKDKIYLKTLKTKNRI